MNSSIKVSDVFQPSWKYMKSQFWILVGLCIGYFIINFTLSIFMLPLAGSVSGSLVSSLVSLLLAVVFSLGYIKNMFQTIDGDEPQFSSYLQSPRKIINAIFASILFGIAISVSCILFIIPGIYLITRLQFYQMFILEEDAGCLDSLKKSWMMTNGKSNFLFLLLMTEVLIIIIGGCLLGIGVFVAYPLCCMMTCYTYRLLTRPSISLDDK